MAQEIQDLRTELSKEEERVFVLEQKLNACETLRGGGKRA